ncbi:MAG: L-lactate dehydrogenase [candidate division FCPU426 bacterium]
MKQKVVIIGAGSVGATFAYALMISGVAREIVLLDMNRERAEGEVMDLHHGVAFAKPVSIRTGTYEDCGDAEVVVITAGAKQKPGESRLDLAGRNVRIIAGMMPLIMNSGFKGVLLITSNPVDVLTQVAWQASGLPRERVLGSGTVLDSARLRSLLAEHCRVDARNIHAMIIGEHGDSEVAAWSAATIGGVPIKKYCADCGTCEPENRYPALLDQVKRAAYEIISRKGATFYAIGLALVQITAAVLRDEHRVLPVSSVQADSYGLQNVALSLPSVVGKNGIERILELGLDAEELAALRQSAAVIKNTLASLQPLG